MKSPPEPTLQVALLRPWDEADEFGAMEASVQTSATPAESISTPPPATAQDTTSAEGAP